MCHGGGRSTTDDDPACGSIRLAYVKAAGGRQMTTLHAERSDVRKERTTDDDGELCEGD
jgi:hypothetical protein